MDRRSEMLHSCFPLLRDSCLSLLRASACRSFGFVPVPATSPLVGSFGFVRCTWCSFAVMGSRLCSFAVMSSHCARRLRFVHVWDSFCSLPDPFTFLDRLLHQNHGFCPNLRNRSALCRLRSPGSLCIRSPGSLGFLGIVPRALFAPLRTTSFCGPHFVLLPLPSLHRRCLAPSELLHRVFFAPGAARVPVIADGMAPVKTKR